MKFDIVNFLKTGSRDQEVTLKELPPQAKFQVLSKDLLGPEIRLVIKKLLKSNIYLFLRGPGVPSMSAPENNILEIDTVYQNSINTLKDNEI